VQDTPSPAERASMNEQLILDRYRLIERIAVGGSAEVWRAHDEHLDRPVAVKRLHPHLLPDDASRKRLSAEARAAAGLSHPVIVGVYDSDATGGVPALVMELVDGESLSARLDRDGPLPARDAAEVTADIAEALYHAHQRGVIHRDVKPGNVLLARDGRTRLVDFGIAHSLAASAERLTMPGTVMGTLRAMSPEQLAGGPITPRTDLWGLGVVLHEALIGRPPYPSSTPIELAEAQRAGPPRLDGVDPALAGVVRACLSPDPADRPLHAGALASALRDWLSGDPAAALALAPSATEVAASPVDTSAVTQPITVVAVPPIDRPEPPPPASRARPIAMLAGLVVLVLLAGIGLAGLAREDQTIGAEESASPSTPSIAPTATPAPPWLAELTNEIGKECSPEITTQASAEMAGMNEEQAHDYAEGVVDACKDAQGKGKGRGNDD
jgi:serine/threonine-protein kinase